MSQSGWIQSRTFFTRFRALFGLRVRDGDRRCDATAGSPSALQLGGARRDNRQKVVENSIRDVLVENAFVPKSLQVQLETLQLDALRVGNITEDECPKIGLTRFGANGGELRANDFDLIVSVGVGIIKAFQLIDKWSS